MAKERGPIVIGNTGRLGRCVTVELQSPLGSYPVVTWEDVDVEDLADGGAERKGEES